MNYQLIRQSNEIITYKLATTCTIASDPVTSHGQIDLAYNEEPLIIRAILIF